MIHLRFKGDIYISLNDDLVWIGNDDFLLRLASSETRQLMRKYSAADGSPMVYVAKSVAILLEAKQIDYTEYDEETAGTIEENIVF